MSRFVAVNLAGMEPPDIIETISFEAILKELKADMSARMADLGLEFDVQDLESDPAVKILEVAADREVILRARVNGAAKALLLALAHRHDLEHLGAWFGVERLIVNTNPLTMEDDERLRVRVQLAPQAFSTAGPHGAYVFHAMTAAPTVKHVGIDVPEPGHVILYPLVPTGDGTPSIEVLRAIRERLLREDVRPLTDVITVTAPDIIHTTVDVTLVMGEGVDPVLLEDRAKTGIAAYALKRHKVGAPFYRSGVYDAAMVPGVDNVIINSPLADIDPGVGGAVYVEAIFVDSQVIRL